MRVVGGPSGAGKSSVFPLRDLGVDAFNVDDRCAELNSGSYRSIPPDVRARANKECEDFIADHIRSRASFAVETTLRSEVTFRQAATARESGFAVYLEYVVAGSIEIHIDRVTARARAGGHAATPGRLRQIYAASMANLVRALREFARVDVYDNSKHLELLLEVHHGRVLYANPQQPEWLRAALRDTEF
jgi:predicted ABC-type ATPase